MKNFQPKDLLFFDKMLTPMVLTFFYWFVTAMTAIGIVIMAIVFSIKVIIYLPFAIVFIRMLFELIMIQFNIAANVKKLADAQKTEDI